jgi:hypothetical protein
MQKQISTDKNDIRLKLINHIRNHVRLTPLEILAKSMEQYEVPEPVAIELFKAYGSFLTLLDDETSRKALKALRAADSRSDPTFQRVREISGSFEGALDHIFFENPHIAPLTRKYGVF